MARIALIKNGVVDACISADPSYVDPEGRQAVVCPASFSKGALYANGTFSLPPDPAPTAADLVSYANAKQAALRDGGITVNLGTASAPNVVDVASDDRGRGLVSGCVQLVGLSAQSGQPAPSFSWLNNNGAMLTLSAAQMQTIGLDLATFVQATYTTLGTVLAAIANGTITTFAGVDAASWPATAY